MFCPALSVGETAVFALQVAAARTAPLPHSQAASTCRDMLDRMGLGEVWDLQVWEAQ